MRSTSQIEGLSVGNCDSSNAGQIMTFCNDLSNPTKSGLTADGEYCLTFTYYSMPGNATAVCFYYIYMISSANTVPTFS